jgi:hypothetical protein
VAKLLAGVLWCLSKLWDWPVVSVVATLIYGFGVAALFGDEYIIAALLFSASIVSITAKAIFWEEARKQENKKQISAIILVFGGACLISSVLWIQHRRHAVEHSLAGPIATSSSVSHTATTDDIAQLKELIAGMGSSGKADKYADITMPGFSQIMLIRLYGKQVNLKSYLFDVGGQNENRLSAYITGDSVLTFMWIDADGEPHPLKASIGKGGIPVNKIFVLTCELGLVDNHPIMRITVNNQEVAFLDDPVHANFVPIPWYSTDLKNTATLAADRDMKHGGSFDSFGVATYSITLTNEGRDQWLVNMGGRLTNPNFVRFTGTQWVKADAKSHTGHLSDSSVWKRQ